jgi:hypothetical protein
VKPARVVRSLVAVALLAVGVSLLASGVSSFGAAGTIDHRYGASRVAGDPGIAIHWVVCAGESASVVDLEGYWGGSQPPTAVSAYWQVRALDPAPRDSTSVETFVVGTTPAGYFETVPLRRPLPNDLVAISSPPGDTRALAGMTFTINDLRRSAVHRGGYELVSHEQFTADGRAACAEGSAAESAPGGLALLALGLGAAIAAGRGHKSALAVGGVVAVTGGLVLLAGVSGFGRFTQGLPSSQGSAAFHAGVTAVPPGREVLLDLSPATRRSRSADAPIYARILVEGGYAFAVSCEGPSIAVGEASAVPRGVTGSRQLLGCATGELVRGALADRGDRDDLIELIIDPNGMTDWRVVVVAGDGAVGPFGEP